LANSSFELFVQFLIRKGFPIHIHVFVLILISYFDRATAIVGEESTRSGKFENLEPLTLQYVAILALYIKLSGEVNKEYRKCCTHLFQSFKSQGKLFIKSIKKKSVYGNLTKLIHANKINLHCVVFCGSIPCG
jgi:hypothetical protein